MRFEIASILNPRLSHWTAQTRGKIFLYLKLVSKISSRLRKKILVVLPIGLVEIDV